MAVQSSEHIFIHNAIIFNDTFDNAALCLIQSGSLTDRGAIFVDNCW